MASSKIKRTISIDVEIFNNLKSQAALRTIPYSLLIEALVDNFLKNPNSYNLNLVNHKIKNKKINKK